MAVNFEYNVFFFCFHAFYLNIRQKKDGHRDPLLVSGATFGRYPHVLFIGLGKPAVNWEKRMKRINFLGFSYLDNRVCINTSLLYVSCDCHKM